MELEQAFRLVIKDGQCVMDIGAFEGKISKMFSELVGPKGKVYSFECHSIHCFALQIRAQHSRPQNIYPFNRALSNLIGFTVLYSDRECKGEASTIIHEKANRERFGGESISCLVETDTIDNFCSTRRIIPDFVKIDVESAQDLVLKGGENTIREHNPSIIYEYGRDGDYPKAPLFLQNVGYHQFIVDIFWFNHEWIPKMEKGGLLQTNYLLPINFHDFEKYEHIGVNLLAVHESMISKLQIESYIAPKRATDFIDRFIEYNQE